MGAFRVQICSHHRTASCSKHVRTLLEIHLPAVLGLLTSVHLAVSREVSFSPWVEVNDPQTVFGKGQKVVGPLNDSEGILYVASSVTEADAEAQCDSLGHCRVEDADAMTSTRPTTLLRMRKGVRCATLIASSQPILLELFQCASVPKLQNYTSIISASLVLL